ncbi:MAG TPA: glycosyltransferase [Phycisphaerales bacterium]|nr:glycosyltransferase [Phycisphaerales bacterium]
MNILHIAASLDPALGGPPRVTARLAAAQAGLGHNVTILSHGDKSVQFSVQQMISGLPCIDRVNFQYMPWSGWRDFYFSNTVKPRLTQLLADNHVIHIHNVWESLNRVVAAAARYRNIPYFIEPNGLLDIWCMEQRKLKKKTALRMGYRRMLDSAAGLCLGNADEAHAINALCLTAPLVIVPLNAIFLEEVAAPPPAGAFGERFPQVADKPFIVFLSRLHHKKGLDYLAESFALFAKSDSQTHLVVVGNDEGAQADFEQRIARHKLTDRVHLVGPLHGVAKWEAFRDARCFILPSRQEGFSIAITEALASGLPAVVSKDCHFPEIAEADAGEVVDLDAASLAAALHRVLDDESRRQQIAANARNLVVTRFNCPTVAATLVQAYQHAIDAAAAPPKRLNGLKKAG